MIIDKDTVATIAYKILLESPEGEVIESVSEANPRELIFGNGQLIAGFENDLMNRGIGDFTFEISPDQAFGPVRFELQVPVPKEAFMDNGSLREDLLIVGNSINMLDDAGRQVKGVVVEINDTDVLMDFNHPLAGKTLFVSGSVFSIRTATEYDLTPSYGSCGCGSCGCGSGHGHDHHSEGDSCCSDEEGCEACGTTPKHENQGVL
ncbi:MAG: FKBP-type peptidyl-prolyl cis-trans isomerase [Bacteroidales bacterium]|nr:FKBP-type peptidyl-prolyl cis-trans isomerase [Bacteroidales bacterium]